MKELDFIRIIENTLANNSYIGDDCAYLKDLGIVITQDSLVEDVHFLQKISSPSDIAYKSVMANLSDIYAAGAVPKYITIALSLPAETSNSFVRLFYAAVDKLAEEYDFSVVGGDITGAEKVMVSICAIGVTKGRHISSRSLAKPGDLIVTTGTHGSSAAGLYALKNGIEGYKKIEDKHLKPLAQRDFSLEISSKVKRYAMIDSSDGLADAVFKIAHSSNAEIILDFDKIPFDKEILDISRLAHLDFRDWIFYGGEDFQLVASLPESDLQNLNADYFVIGRVESEVSGGLLKVIDNGEIHIIDNIDKSFNHFEGK